ncbi:MAG: glucose-6-phosphate dehydrogenase, partial [Eudoraea sp.]|nr:glucose-6-phosphate dehydrogenase [Eudoraea sp.]
MLIIFGASGDLTARKLIPALYHLHCGGHLPKKFLVLGVSRSPLSDNDFRDRVAFKSSYLNGEENEIDPEQLSHFADKLFYHDLGNSYEDSYESLAERINSLNTEFNTLHNFIFYLSTPPSIYEVIAKNLSEQGLTQQNKGWKRMIVEKPFGYDLASARELNN